MPFSIAQDYVQERLHPIQIDYSSKVDVDPRTLPPEISWDFDDSTQPYFLDYNPNGILTNQDGSPGNPVVNSVGQTFENFLERETGSIRATYKLNVSVGVYDPDIAVQYKDAVNIDGFLIDGKSIKPNQGKMKAYTAAAVQNQWVNGAKVYYRAITFTLQFRKSWDDVIDDRGLQELDDNKKPRDICLGTPPIKPDHDHPWPLKKGKAQPLPSSPPDRLTFVPYKKKPFSQFQFQ